MFSEREQARYERHFSLPGFGVNGQAALAESSALCIGAGGLGSPAALYLAAAGVGRLGIVDDDEVDLSNLQRQILHDESWLGVAKAESARARLRELNSDITIEALAMRLNGDNVMDLFARYDVIVDGSDNFPTRFLVADAAWLLGKPLVAGAIHQFEGQLSVYDPRLPSPCYRCLLPEPPPPGTVPT
jgi:adenylyltransferase/sulfurtransferase